MPLANLTPYVSLAPAPDTASTAATTPAADTAYRLPATRRLGLLGGTFDPVHEGHLRLAHCALEQYQLDLVLFIPTGLPVRKLGATVASAEHRLAMLRLACADEPRFEVSSLELDRAGITYTIDTLEELRRREGPDTQFFLICGEDTALDLATWKDAEKIARLASVLYAPRLSAAEGSTDPLTTQQFPNDFVYHPLCLPPLDVSSTCIRAQLASLPLGEQLASLPPEAHLVSVMQGAQESEGAQSAHVPQELGPQALLPAAVSSYIKKHRLYESG